MSRTMLTAKEAADFLLISYDCLLNNAKKNLIPHVRVGNRVLFSLEGLESWIAEQEAEIMKPTKTEPKIIDYGKLRKIQA